MNKDVVYLHRNEEILLKRNVKLKYIYADTFKEAFKIRFNYFYDLFLVGGGPIILDPLKCFGHFFLGYFFIFLFPFLLSFSFSIPANFFAFRYMSFSPLIFSKSRMTYREMKVLDNKGLLLKKLGVRVVKKGKKTYYSN